MTDATQSPPDAAAVSAALDVMHSHMAGLNARDAKALTATLHFPHYRLSRGRLQVWEGPESYLGDFFKRTDPGWERSTWDFLNVVAASADKVHIDAGFTRFGAGDRVLGRYRSLWVIAKLGDRWGAQLRSSFAA